LLPALAVGCASLWMLTMAVADGQLPLLTVHKKVLEPVERPVTSVVEVLTEIMLPPPESTDHAPAPLPGGTAFNVTDVAQSVWLLPALAVGARSRVMVTRNCRRVRAC
jgi:hypothetical protein